MLSPSASPVPSDDEDLESFNSSYASPVPTATDTPRSHSADSTHDDDDDEEEDDGEATTEQLFFEST